MQRNPGAGGLWAQVADLSPNYMNLLIQAGMPMLCLRASVMIVEERRHGMLAPLALAGISPVRLVGSKLKGALRPAALLTAIILILWVWSTATVTGHVIGFIDLRLWLDSVVALAAIGAGYFVAIALGLLASSCAPSLRVALLAGPALLYAWVNAPPLIQQVLLLAWPGIPLDLRFWLFHLIGGEPDGNLNALTRHAIRFEPHDPVNWVVSWVAVETLAGLVALIAAVFRMSREHGRPARRSARIPPGPA
jgi:hypothetical protein